jgi:hypothetical protein
VARGLRIFLSWFPVGRSGKEPCVSSFGAAKR